MEKFSTPVVVEASSSSAVTAPITPGAMKAMKLGPWGRLFVPSFTDCFFLAVLIWLFLAGASGWKALLMDGDAGWHIRTGEYILDHRSIPVQDIFSFSKAGAPWFTWEWLSDVIFGVLFRIAGLKAVVLFAGALIALLSTVLLRYTVWKGANVMAALPLILLAVGSSTIHFLARPHLFTLLLLPVSIWMLEADRKSPGRSVWMLIPLTAIWTNLHGGFAIFLACLALLVVGVAAEAWFGNRCSAEVKRYSLLFVGCLLATLANPFGLGLHRHILEYLRSSWIRDLVQEFQAPTFRSEGQFQFEILLFMGLLIVPALWIQKRYVPALWIVFLAHLSLTSVRHAPLFAAVAAPIVAAEATLWWTRWSQGLGRQSLGRILYELGQDLAPQFRRTTPWVLVSLAVIAGLNAPIAWPQDFPSEAFPVEIVHRYSALLASGRVLSTDQWADYLIFASYPSQKVFFDGRSDFYGEDLGRQYLALMQGTFTARAVLDRYKFDVILIPVDWPLAQWLKGRPGWKIVEDNGKAILFTAEPPAHSIGTTTANVNTRNSRTL